MRQHEFPSFTHQRVTFHHRHQSKDANDTHTVPACFFIILRGLSNKNTNCQYQFARFHICGLIIPCQFKIILTIALLRLLDMPIIYKSI